MQRCTGIESRLSINSPYLPTALRPCEMYAEIRGLILRMSCGE